jgi:hypothetical protein
LAVGHSQSHRIKNFKTYVMKLMIKVNWWILF